MSHLNKKVLGAGTALVALSAFVPNPFMIGEAMAQATAQDTMNITAKVVNPLKVQQVTKLNFGSIAVSKASGNYVVNATGGQTITHGVVIAAPVTGKVQFTAPKSATFTIEVTDLKTSSILLKNGAGTKTSLTMKVDNIYLQATANMKIAGGTKQTTFVKAGVTKATAVVTTGGTGTAKVGAKLNFKPNQAVGSYLGTYNMIITF